MELIGEYLKKEREAKGIPLKEIAGATHIGLRFLEAIEQEDFKTLPGEIFVRGFIKTYANYIGLDSNEILDRYTKCFEKKKEEREGGKTPETEIKPSSYPGISHQKPSTFLPLILGVLALLGLGVYLGDFVMVGSKIPPEMAESKSDTSPVAHKPGVPSRENGKELVKEETIGTREEATPLVLGKMEETSATGQKPKGDISPLEMARKIGDEPNPATAKVADHTPGAAVEKKMILKMTAESDAWMRVKVDNLEMSKEFMLKAGETSVFKAEKELSITTGNAGGVKLFLNGREIAWPRKGSVIHDFVLTLREEEGRSQETVTLPPL